jgi:hypothetical protein
MYRCLARRSPSHRSVSRLISWEDEGSRPSTPVAQCDSKASFISSGARLRLLPDSESLSFCTRCGNRDRANFVQSDMDDVRCGRIRYGVVVGFWQVRPQFQNLRRCRQDRRLSISHKGVERGCVIAQAGVSTREIGIRVGVTASTVRLAPGPAPRLGASALSGTPHHLLTFHNWRDTWQADKQV